MDTGELFRVFLDVDICGVNQAVLKELLISFFVCLVLGAIINGLSVPQAQAPEPAPPAEQPNAGSGAATEGTPKGSGAEGGSGAAGQKDSSSSSTGKKAQEIGETTFDQDVLQSRVPVLVDFNASWCQPCQAMAPIVDSLSAEYSGKAKVCRVDTDKNPGLAGRFHISLLPTFVLFRDGQAVCQYSGQMAKEMLAGVIDHQLGTQ